MPQGGRAARAETPRMGRGSLWLAAYSDAGDSPHHSTDGMDFRGYERAHGVYIRGIDHGDNIVGPRYHIHRLHPAHALSVSATSRVLPTAVSIRIKAFVPMAHPLDEVSVLVGA